MGMHLTMLCLNTIDIVTQRRHYYNLLTTQKLCLDIGHSREAISLFLSPSCLCPVAEWLERRAEEHIGPRCAGSKPRPGGLNVMAPCLSLRKGNEDDIYMKNHDMHYNCKRASVLRVRIKIYYNITAKEPPFGKL